MAIVWKIVSRDRNNKRSGALVNSGPYALDYAKGSIVEAKTKQGIATFVTKKAALAWLEEDKYCHSPIANPQLIKLKTLARGKQMHLLALTTFYHVIEGDITNLFKPFSIHYVPKDSYWYPKVKVLT